MRRPAAHFRLIAFSLLALGLCALVPLTVASETPGPPHDLPAAQDNPQGNSARQPEGTSRDFFARQIAPLFAKHCVSCHNETGRKGGLSLQTSASAFKGGESGEVILPGDPASSYLLDLITPTDGKAEMPKGGHPLDEASREALRQWIAAGAKWPAELRLEEPVWWSLAKLGRPPVPQVDAARANWLRTPIDAFIAARQQELDLQPAPEADRRTLIRRLSFDLLGLPPTPDEIAAFENDTRPLAYERLIERMLAAPRYGERWARHWLDVVHYGETHGYDKDKPRPNAWPYRDYVIRAFNADKPYAKFVREQVAGDVFAPGTRDGLEALGFIAAGPWDFIGHVELPESKIDGQIARHLDRDDMVQNTITSFLSLTVGCAQCHNHKFDPITQRDYYQLQAVFAAVDRTDLDYDADPRIAAQRKELSATRDQLAQQIAQLQQELAAAAGPRWNELQVQIAALEAAPSVRPPQFGYHSAIEQRQDAPKWVQIDLGEPRQMAEIELVPCHDDFAGIGDGFGFPRRYKLEVSNDPEFTADVRSVLDQTAADVPNPGLAPQRARTNELARFVRITATQLAPRQGDFIFALAEIRVRDAAGQNLAIGKTVTALDSIEAPVRWGKANLVDGLDPLPTESAADDRTQQRTADLAALRLERDELIAQVTTADIRDRLTTLSADYERAQAGLAKLPPLLHVYAGAVHNGSGNFSGTHGQPRTIHLLRRGDVTAPDVEVPPGVLACLSGLAPEVDLSITATDAERRAVLAGWLTDANNPLVWRSIVNRVWQYHFGEGLVATPNDFGRMGEEPSLPELLDWLAANFRDSGGSLKDLHRLIVTSSVYRQRSSVEDSSQTQRAAELDPQNRLLWRMNRRRLEAEAIHDAVLVLADRLNGTMEGPSYQDFVIEKPEHSPHYRYDLHDPNSAASQRRAVYRMIVRSQTQPLMTALDCADPSMQVARRNESNTPLQALTMLNNRFNLVMAGHFAERLQRESNDPSEQVRAAFLQATGREPTADERAILNAYAAEHGLANACRVILNLNEFLFVD